VILISYDGVLPLGLLQLAFGGDGGSAVGGSVEEAMPIVTQQLEKAGIRLAATLNAALK
jgi:hypothetical protein